MRSNAGIVLKGLASKIKKAQAGVPKILANVGQNYFLSNFQKQAWRDTVYKKWPARKDKKNTRPLLIGKTRKLRQSIQRSIKVANAQQIKWGTSVPYAQIHNDGGIIMKKRRTVSVGFRDKGYNLETGKTTKVFASRKRGRKAFRATSYKNVLIGAHSINIPQRRFMGTSRVLNALLIQKYKQILYAIK